MIAVIHRVGDTCAEDHGGGAVVRTEDGYYLEWTHGLEAEHPGEDAYGDNVGDLVLELYRVQLDEAAYTALSGCGDETKLWTDIAETCGQDPEEVLRLAKSEDPKLAAGAFEMFAMVYGWRELDPEPMQLSYRDVESRWEG